MRSLPSFLLALLLLLTLGTTIPVRAQEEPPIVYERYDVEITARADGTFLVREVQQIRFQGVYRTAFAEIPLAYVGELLRVQVSDEAGPFTDSLNGAPGSFYSEKDGGNLYVQWYYPPTEPGDVRTFILEYEVLNGLWVYEDEQNLEWRAVPADRSGFPVEASRVTVTLPEAVAPDDLRYTALGPAFEANATDTQVIFEATEPLPDGTLFQVRVGFPPDLTAATLQPWQREEELASLVYHLDSFSADIFVGSDGLVTIEEQQRLAVDEGVMREGTRTFSLAYLDEFESIQLWEGEQAFEAGSGCEYCFSTRTIGGTSDWIRYDPDGRTVEIDEARAGRMTLWWHFPDLVKGEATTFRLRYTLSGLIVQDEAQQRLDWTFSIPGGQQAVENATIQLHLPPDVLAGPVNVAGGIVRPEADGTQTITHDGPLRPNEEWEINVTLPAGATSGPVPRWQQALEAARGEAQAAQTALARQRLGFGLGGLLLLVGGLLGIGLLWFRWGRDPEVPLVAEYLAEPPSPLPPGIVAYLVDEAPTPKGALASLFHLATLGLLRIDLKDGVALQRNGPESLAEGQRIETATGEVTIPGHLVTLYNHLAPKLPTEQVVTLEAIYSEFQKALPLVYAKMGEEATEFFAGLPTQARHRWLTVGQGLMLLAGVGGFCFFVSGMGEIGAAALMPLVALLIVGVALIAVSRWMGQRTRVGSEEAARWLAFKRYLLNLKQYGTLESAQAILDRDFAYAVALDAEEVALKEAEALGGQMPIWSYPTQVLGSDPTPNPTTGSQPMGSQPSAPPRLRTVPQRPTLSNPTEQGGGAGSLSLQGLSNRLAGSVNEASRSLAGLLNQASREGVGPTPFTIVQQGVSKTTSSTFDVLGDILEASSTGSGGGSYSSGSSGSRSSSSSSSRRSSWSSSSSSRSSSSSSSSRRSGGGGRRGFG